MTKPLRILITNNTLDYRAGTELYVRDVATALLQRGHAPIAYSTRLGEVADELRRSAVTVVSDLDQISEPPDVIHGHHHFDTMTALIRFPNTPVVSFCHGWLPWEEMPPQHPRILQYIAVDEACRERLVNEHGISPDSVKMLLNFVDLKRFQKRQSPLLNRATRALVFSNYASENSYLKAVRDACAEMNIELDVVGLSSGNVCRAPEKILSNYHIVFAKGRAAQEAVASGNSVILCDAVGLGPMVSPTNLSQLRLKNMGIRSLQNPITVDNVLARLREYNPTDAEKVTHEFRSIAGMEQAIDTLLEIYHETIQNYDSSVCAEEHRFVARYLQSIAPASQMKSKPKLEKEIHRLRQEKISLEANISRQAEEIRVLKSKFITKLTKRQPGRFFSKLKNSIHRRIAGFLS